MSSYRAHAIVLSALSVLSSVSGCAIATRTETTGGAPHEAAVTGGAHWPRHDCDQRVGEARDYVSGAPGFATRTQALLAEAPGSGYRLERVPPHPHQRAAWWIIDIETNEIYEQASAFHGDGGWLVDEVERCA